MTFDEFADSLDIREMSPRDIWDAALRNNVTPIYEAQPMQPVIRDEDGIVRFQCNQIVWDMYEYAKDNYDFSLAAWRSAGYADEDWEQLDQLFGMSLSHFSDSSYASQAVLARAKAEAENLIK